VTGAQRPTPKMETLGSARVSRAGERVLAIADFAFDSSLTAAGLSKKDCFGATPKPTRETRALPATAETLQSRMLRDFAQSFFEQFFSR
jgi:hypothetical protein